MWCCKEQLVRNFKKPNLILNKLKNICSYSIFHVRAPLLTDKREEEWDQCMRMEKKADQDLYRVMTEPIHRMLRRHDISRVHGDASFFIITFFMCATLHHVLVHSHLHHPGMNLNRIKKFNLLIHSDPVVLSSFPILTSSRLISCAIIIIIDLTFSIFSCANIVGN